MTKITPTFAWVRVHTPFGNWIARVTNITYWEPCAEAMPLSNTYCVEGDWKHCSEKGYEKGACYDCAPLKFAELLRLKKKGFIS